MDVIKNKFTIEALETIEVPELFPNLDLNKIPMNHKIKQENNNDNNNIDYSLKENEIILEENEKEYSNQGLNFLNFNDFITKNKDMSKSKSLKNINKTSSKINNHQKYLELLSKPKKINKSEEEMKTPIKKNNFIKNKDLFHLYEDYKKIEDKKDKMKEEYLEQKMKDCSFSPTINKLSKNVFQEKYNKFYKNPKKYFNKCSNLQITDSNICSNKNFKRISNKKNSNSLDVYSRLYKTRNTYDNNRINYYDSDEINCYFQPITNSNKKKENNNICFKSFMKRQKLFNNYLIQKKLAMKNNINEIQNKKCTFTPNTSCTSNSIYSIKLDAQRIDETYLDKINRIIKKDISNNNCYTNIACNNSINNYINYKNNLNYKKLKRNQSANFLNKSKSKDKRSHKHSYIDYLSYGRICDDINKNCRKNEYHFNNSKGNFGNYNNNKNILSCNNEKCFYINNNKQCSSRDINAKNKNENNYIKNTDNIHNDYGICLNIADKCKNIKYIIEKNKKQINTDF